MQLKDHVCLMAQYNRTINQRIYAVAEKLSPQQLHQDSGAFFGSVLGTLNHIAVADTIWLKRLIAALPAHTELKPVAELPLPESLGTILCDDLDELCTRRNLLDEALSAFAASITDAELLQPVTYKNMKGEAFSKLLFGLLMHVFNHQTHHRGQLTTLLSQFGVDYGSTDLVVLVPNV